MTSLWAGSTYDPDRPSLSESSLERKEKKREMSRFKTTVYVIKRGVQIMAGVTLFKEKVGDLRWCEGASMLPTLNVTGDLLVQVPISSIFNTSLLEKNKSQDVKNLHRGDLVNFTSPLNPSVLACKRIIGLPGDQILIDDDHHYESFMPSFDSSLDLERTHQPKSLLTIPKGHLWLQGDNCAVSVDSRTYGPVPIALVSGKIVARVWPNFTWLSQPFKYPSNPKST